jgi:hypothetical protein
MDCEAISATFTLGTNGFISEGHGTLRWPTLFVDGRASLTKWSDYRIDPDGSNGWGMGSLGWADVR